MQNIKENQFKIMKTRIENYIKNWELIGDNVKFSSNVWQSLYPATVVHDPDGWDRRNYNYSWYEELITLNEYNKRLNTSTIHYKCPCNLCKSFLRIARKVDKK